MGSRGFETRQDLEELVEVQRRGLGVRLPTVDLARLLKDEGQLIPTIQPFSEPEIRAQLVLNLKIEDFFALLTVAYELFEPHIPSLRNGQQVETKTIVEITTAHSGLKEYLFLIRALGITNNIEWMRQLADLIEVSVIAQGQDSLDHGDVSGYKIAQQQKQQRDEN